MYCRNCGKQIPDEAAFCPECGERVIHVDQRGKTTKTEERRQAIQKEKASAKTRNTSQKKGGILKPLLLLGILAGLVYAGKDLFTEYIGGSKDRPVSVTVIPSENKPTNTTTAPAAKPGTTTQNAQTTKPSTPNNPITNNTSGNTGSGTWEEDLMPKTIDDITMAVFDDFIFPEKMMESGIPQNVEYLQPYTAEGAWKYELIFAADDYTEIGLCELIFGQNGIRFELYPSQSMYGNELYTTDRETVGYDTFTGSMREEDFILQDPAETSTIVISPFFRIEGTEYAFGSIVTNSGSIGSFLFTRP